MIKFVTYSTSTGRILARNVVSQDDAFDLYPNGKLIVGIDLTEEKFNTPVEQQCRVVSGALVDKAVVTITRTKTIFSPDGVDSTTLTFSGLTANAYVHVNFTSVLVTVADPTLVITSDTEQEFEVELIDHLHYSERVTVFASTDTPIIPNAGTITIATSSPLMRRITLSTGAIGLVGKTPLLIKNEIITPSVGTVTIDGESSTVS